ncbi:MULTISPECIES: cobalamin biosynthesis protein [unclassified Calothrix]|uniref:cobalamin biosynthesis protein n=1 Tax=unclassified Calothrix TaxID=2619626 RepID=UPI0028C44CB1|nr:cobalamin biosynthesis protein [Calothrix sp. FACHB-168]
MNVKSLWVGIGCQRGTSTQLLEKAIAQVFRENQLNQNAIAGIATIDNKAKEPALLEFCQLHNLAFKTFPAEVLRLVCVPNPAKLIEQTVGTPSVAEAAAMLAAADINWLTQIIDEILPLNPNASHLTPTLTPVRVRCLVPKQIFRLPDEPGAVTIAVAQELTKIASVIDPNSETQAKSGFLNFEF